MEDSGGSGKVPAPSPLTRQREEYARLVARGSAAPRRAGWWGVNRRTGTRWRYGRSVPSRAGTQRRYPAMIDATNEECLRSARYLSEEERRVITDRRRAEHSMRMIARELGRASRRSAVSWPATATRAVGTARPWRTGWRPPDWRVRGHGRSPPTRSWRAVAQGKLDAKCSPEQISHTLALIFPDDTARRLAPETIHQALYVKCPVLQRDPATCLRSGDPRSWRSPGARMSPE